MFDNFELWKDLAFLEKFSDNFLRNEVKYYLELKRKDDPNVILKENVIFNYVKCVEKAYYDFLNKNDKKLVSYPIDDKNLLKEMIIQVTEKHASRIKGLNDYDRIQLQDSNKYKQELCENIVRELIVNKHIGQISKNISFFNPFVSKIIMVVNLLHKLYKDQYKQIKDDDKLNAVGNVFLRITEQMKSCCLLVDNALLNDAITIWRSLFESELTLTVLIYQPLKISEAYLRFIAFQNLDNPYIFDDEERKEVEEDLENLMKHYKITNRKKDFIHYGWLMFLSDFEEKNCKPNLKDGLLPIAESYIKYEQYESASKVSHSAYFARSLSYKESKKFVLNLLYYSFANVTNAMKYYFERCIKNFNNDALIEILINLKFLRDMLDKLD